MGFPCGCVSRFPCSRTGPFLWVLRPALSHLVGPTLIITRGVSFPGISITGREVRWGRATIVRSPAINIRVRRIVAGRTVGLLITATTGRGIIINRSTAGRGSIAAAAVVIVIPTRRGGPVAVAVAVSIAAGTITASRRSTAVVVVNRGRVGATGRTRPGTIAGREVRLCLIERVSGVRRDMYRE